MKVFETLKSASLVIVLCATMVITSPAQRVVPAPSITFDTLASFDGANGADSANSSFSSLIQGADGNLYGTTSGGGLYDQGTVFRMTPAGAATAIYSFCSKANCSDGALPIGSLVQAPNGDFYGTTFTGGKYQYGTVFQLTTAGKLTTLHSFGLNAAGGFNPHAGLVEFNGDYYGTTAWGGQLASCTTNIVGCGTIFRISASGTFSTLYSFCSQIDCADGSVPFAGLIQYGGSLYGTTQFGGAYDAGSVFAITPSGTLTTISSFNTQFFGGFFPYAGLAVVNGNFYGTTPNGGADGLGTVFQVNTSGQMSTLYSFILSNGGYAYGGVIVGADGNLYGTTQIGGAHNYGTAFEITPGGSLTTLHSFDLADGGYPEGGLLQTANGTFYGIASYGGTRLDGAIFSLSVNNKQ